MSRSIYPSKYKLRCESAQDIAARKGHSVYVARAKRKNHYVVLMSQGEKTPNYDIVAEVKPDGEIVEW